MGGLFGNRNLDFGSDKVKQKSSLSYAIEIDEVFKELLIFSTNQSVVRMLFVEGL